MECSNHHVNLTGCCQCLVASKQVPTPPPSRINLKPSSAHQLGAYNKSNLAVFHITFGKQKVHTSRTQGSPCLKFCWRSERFQATNFWIHKQLPCLWIWVKALLFLVSKKSVSSNLGSFVCDCAAHISPKYCFFFDSCKQVLGKLQTWKSVLRMIFNLFFLSFFTLSLLGSLYSFIRMVTDPLKLLQSTTENG